MLRRLSRLAFVFVIGTLLVACGGGGGGGSKPPPPPPPPPAPSGLTYTSPQNLRVNAAMTAITPTVTGSVTSYTVSPALPAGLALNATTGQISGTPTVMAAPASYTVTATNSSGSTNFPLALKVYGIELQSANLARIASQNSPITAQAVVRAVNFDPGTLFATASDPSGLILSAVTVAPGANGTYTLGLATNASVSPALFAGDVTINLCKDAGCATPQDVPTVTVPFSIRVLASNSAWPGDNKTALAAIAGAPDWTMFQGNAAHTGFVPVTLKPDQFTLRWKTAGNSLYSPWIGGKQNLVTSNGIFYVVSSDHTQGGVVYAKRESDASEVWHFTVDGMSWPAANPVAVSNGVVYFAAGHQSETFMFARNAADGTAAYRADMVSQWEAYYAPTIGPNGMLYANAGTYGGMYGFDPQGNQLFFANEAQQSNWTPAVNATGVYAYTGDRLQVVDPLTGLQAVSIQDPNYQNWVYEIGGAPVLGDAALGSVFAAPYINSNIGLGTGGVYNYLTNFRTINGGSIAWQKGGAYPSAPAYHAGVVYAVNQAPLRLEARAETDGALLWSWTPANVMETAFASEVLLIDNLVFVSTNYATHAIDLATHESVWNYPLSGKLTLSANGVLYIHNFTDLVAVNLK
jgi:hypothetical protein